MIGYYTYLPRKAIMVKSFKTMQNTQCLSLDVTVSSLYTGQAFACKCVGLRMVLSGAVSLGSVIPSLVFNSVALSPIPDASLSRHRGFISS